MTLGSVRGITVGFDILRSGDAALPGIVTLLTVLLDTADDFFSVTLLREELPDIGLITVDLRLELTDDLPTGAIVTDFLELEAVLLTGAFFDPPLPAISIFMFSGREVLG